MRVPYIGSQQPQDRIAYQAAIFWSGTTPALNHARKISPVMVDIAVLFNIESDTFFSFAFTL